jgi:hypothetical protein
LKEDILQAEIYKYYHNKYCTKFNETPHVIFAVPNGGIRGKMEAIKLKATGVVAGVSDLIVLQPNRTVFVEVKIETGRQSDKQKDFQQRVEALGFEYLIVRSLEEFKQKI